MSAPFPPPFPLGAARATVARIVGDEIKPLFDTLEWDHAESVAGRIAAFLPSPWHRDLEAARRALESGFRSILPRARGEEIARLAIDHLQNITSPKVAPAPRLTKGTAQ